MKKEKEKVDNFMHRMELNKLHYEKKLEYLVLKKSIAEEEEI